MQLVHFPSAAGFDEGQPGKWQVSTSTGSHPVWRADGKELFFITGGGEVTAVDFAAENGTPRIGTPHVLFQTNASTLGIYSFTVAPDGKRFIVNTLTEAGANRPLTLVTNWTAELKK